ncbi:uncharacterized protein LOC131982909 [Centropristis striata]|uniref:uncharacterized protein LOC131982909 n=1 Tax=Centropristis striata TaxID=184440 RepID=UPI0027E095A5|nr:uncharacterized protein LOC131982909 [Centropristis striata]
MASTGQSALGHVRNARKYLVGKLKNLSVILDNLNQENSKQQRVLIDAAVREIQAKTNDDDKIRDIVDRVIKQGEAACYEFLRVIYLTRKRTLDVDLHHWIISFPFSEDTQMDINHLQGSTPCHRYQAKLKLKARKISNNFWMANRNLFKENNKPDLPYMTLVLDTQGSVSPSKTKKLKCKKSKLSRRKKLKKYIPEVKAETSPSDLLKRNGNILLVGKPGIGKTALAHEMLKLWAERQNKELDYMFYFDMRETAHIRDDSSLEDLLFSVFSEPDESKEEVLQDIKSNSDNVTLIFDGITDLSSSVVKRLVEKDLLPDAKIIVTCRPDDEDEFSSEDFLRVEVKGFSEQTIKTYLSAMLGEEQEKVLRNVELLTLCHVPMYALMVAACFSYETPEDSPQPCTMTEIYISIVRHCLQINSNNTKKKHLNSFIKTKGKALLSLAEVAFHATEGKSVNLTECPCEDSCVLSFLKPLFVEVGPTETITTSAFLHYTMQEFFAAVWLVKNPDKIKDVFQQCLTEEKKHMKHLIPFMCRLLNEKSPSLMKCLIPAEKLKNTSNWFFEEMISTLSPHLCKKDDADPEDSELDVDILFLCQCLYESQCPEACLDLLHKLDYHLDLSGESLDPYPCCAVAYVVTQLKERKIHLNLEDVMVSEQGMRRLFGCLKNAQWSGPLPRQLWEIFLLNEGQMRHLSLPGLDENELHLPVEGKRHLFERAATFMQKRTTKVNVCLHWERKTPVCQSLCRFFFEALPHIRSLSFRMPCRGSGLQDQQQCLGTLQREERQLLLDLCLKAALYKEENFHDVVINLLSLFSVNTELHNILLDFYQHVKKEDFPGVIPKLRPLFQSAPAVWTINLSERKTSILLEVLKLQPQKKQVELRGFSDEESEVRSFLQCLPYISQLSFVPQSSEPSEEIKFFGNLFCAAAEREQQTGEKILQLLSSLCRYKRKPLKDVRCDFLLDLFSHLKDYETKTGLSVLPSLQSVFQSAPAVWTINLSERKTSILLEVLKLQPEKKQVKLRGFSDEESEVRSFLQCLPYISQLRCDFLLDLFSHLKDYETKTGLSVLPSLQSVFQSAPAVWTINLSERKTSILLEVLKLQPEKKQVELRGFSDEESEVRSFLQCLPYISQLRRSGETKFFGNMLCAAAEREQQTGEKILELLSSLCRYETFPFHRLGYYDDDQQYQSGFLLDLFSHLKDYETKTGLSVLPSLQSVFQSAPAVWTINLSERKTSILLEVLKLQPQKKQVELRGFSDEESEVRSFLQCLPYISQLSSSPSFSSGEAKFFGNLFCAAAEREQQTGEKILELLSSLCRYEAFPFHHLDDDDDEYYQSDFLLDLFSHLKDYETKTGLSVLPSLQSVFQSAPAVWIINLSERKTSILLEVLKLQTEKKQVELIDFSDEESEVRSFLQCLPYISQLSCDPEFFQSVCSCISVRSREEAEQLVSLLQLLGFTLLLTGGLSTRCCRSVGTVLGLCGSDVDLILKPGEMSVEEASLLFSSTVQLHSLTLSHDSALLLCGWVKKGRVACSVTIEELSLSPQTARPSEKVSLKVDSGLASLLRYWKIRRLNLTEFCVPALSLIPLLLHDGSLTIRLSEDTVQQFLFLLHENQDGDLTRSFLIKVGGDLSSCCLNWELLHFLLQQSSAQTITVNLKKNSFLQESITRLLPFLDRVVLKRLSPSFVLTAVREIYHAGASPSIPSLLRSLNHVISLTCREMDSVDCAALIFTLRHSDKVKLNLMWTSIPAGEVKSIILMLDKVSQLSVDRKLLLRLVHCCASSDVQQEAAVVLLRSLQHTLDLSCSSCVELLDQDQSDTLSLTADDCRAVSTILRHSSSRDTQLILQDCEVEDSGLDLLFSVLDRVCLRASKAVLLQLVSLVSVNSERDSVRRAESLCRALKAELDLSHSSLDQRTCEALALMLDFCAELTELDLSHCQLTDQQLLSLCSQLHKVQVLDLSHNNITDASTDTLLQLVSINPGIQTVRLFRNNIVDRSSFQKDKRFEIW